jgi:acetyltransferase-like isoleucine patch superfamily enzyme
MLNLLLSLLPSFLHVPIRKLLGARIGKGTKIKWGSFIGVPNRSLQIGEEAIIGPLVFIRSGRLTLGSASKIKPLVKIDVGEIDLGSYVTINSFALLFGNKISVGDHSWIMFHCYIDSTKEVRIGKKVGIGGHSFIFTHGGWQDYIEGGPLAFGPVTLEDNAWIPWRAFIMPNVTIGRNAILGANSLANKSIPAYKVAVGSPAKVIGDVPVVSDPAEKRERAERIIQDYKEANPSSTLRVAIDGHVGSGYDVLFLVNITLDAYKTAHPSDMPDVTVIDHPNSTVYLKHAGSEVEAFITFLTGYGIRLYRVHL